MPGSAAALDRSCRDAGLGHAANYLYMLTGKSRMQSGCRALETYLNTVIDHGLNASTFTARVIMSTGSDLVSAVVGAIGALKGPLHGGAPGPALDMVFEIGDASRAEGMLRRKLESGERLMGFGHRVYKVRDPRADVLARAAERLFTRAGDMSLYTPCPSGRTGGVRLLELYKPGRRLQTNVEFYTALLLHGLGLEVSLFTPTFAASRVSGWIAHALEQQRTNRIIRPQSEYIGPRGRNWIPLPDASQRLIVAPRWEPQKASARPLPAEWPTAVGLNWQACARGWNRPRRPVSFQFAATPAIGHNHPFVSAAQSGTRCRARDPGTFRREDHRWLARMTNPAGLP